MTPRLRLRVSAPAETRLRSGHPWLFENSVREQNREGAPGELAVVYDRRDRFLAVGLYDPTSPIRLRALHAGNPVQIGPQWWTDRFQQAVTRRAGVITDDTDGYRVINGESDGWPGLVLDRYADTLALKVYTLAWFAHWDTVLGLLDQFFPGFRVVLRMSRNIARAAGEQFGLHDGAVLRGSAPDGPVIFRENGLRFEADVIRGQKTGFFLDQRDNRRLVERLSSGRRVLNAFSFSGGFSLYAARGGAVKVTSLDISAHALDGARRNFALNDDPAVRACDHQTVQADVFDWLKESRERFDLIILDPPSLAKRETEREGAIRAYGKLVQDALTLLSPGGVLVSASCSAHVSAEEFFGAVRDAARRSGRTFRELRTTRHAADHHASIPEMQYLKAIYLQF